MSQPAETLDEPGFLEAHRGIVPILGALGLGFVVLCLLFRAEVVFAVQTWIDSTAYNHCFLVIPIAGYLLWERRFELEGAVARPLPLAALLGLPLAAVWLAAERLGIMEGRQLIFLTFVQLLFFTLLGPRLWLRVCGPLLYLYFLVPFGEFLVPKLQDITAVFIRHGVQVLGIPAYIDGYVIEIPAGTFYVAEACAGLRFLIASIAFGCLYALLMYRSAARRIAFIAISIVVPVIANGFRALGIVWLGHLLGSAEAAAADHVLYGWIFFSIVILLLVAIGLPFRQDLLDPPPPRQDLDMPRASRLALAGALGVMVVAGVSPAAAAWLNAAAHPVDRSLAALQPTLGCTTIPASPTMAVATPGRLTTQRLACGTAEFDVTIEVFSRRTTAGPVMTERRRLTRLPNTEDQTEDWLVSGSADETRVWRMVRGQKPFQIMGVSLWVDGEPARQGLPMRTRLAWTSLTGAALAPVLVTVRPVVNWDDLSPEQRRRTDTALTEFLLSRSDFAVTVRQLAATESGTVK
jgi:exosortase A